MLQGLFFIFLFLIIGESIKYLFNLPIPGNVIGMILIFLSLHLKWLDLKRVKPASDILTRHLALFFIPPGVGLMVYFNLISKYWPAIVIASVISTILVLWITAILFQKTNTHE